MKHSLLLCLSLLLCSCTTNYSLPVFNLGRTVDPVCFQNDNWHLFLADGQWYVKGLRCTYIATSPRCDDEMNDRIRRHQERRIGWNWKTIEEEIDLAGAVSAAAADGAEAILIDCLTLWINNLLYRNPAFGEDEMRADCEKLLSAIGRFPDKAVLVIN